jgi:predicted dinucleotide-binding enzyme
MKIAIIGAGRLGSALGGRLAAAGHLITFAGASGTAREAAQRTPGSSAAGTTVAVSASELVVLAVPYAAIGEALRDAGGFDGRILWSCVNALKPDISGLAVGFTTSAAEEVAARAPSARVVAAVPPFADQLTLGTPLIGGRAPTVFCCSDDSQAKATVAGLVRQLGADPADAGPLAASRLVEPAMMLLVALTYATTPPRVHGLALLRAD